MSHDFSHDEPAESAFTIARRVRERDVSCVQVITSALERIRLLDPRFHFIVEVATGQALDRAKELDTRLANGENPGRLTGVPIARKFKEERYAATRLEAAGCIVVGTTTKPNQNHKTRYQSWGANDDGPTANPWNVARSSGGSSAGSGVAVALGAVPIATASDGAGSTRIPAAWCGVFGLKTTRGLIPSYYKTADTTRGPITRTVRDATLYLDAVAASIHQQAARSVPLTSKPILAVWSPNLGFSSADEEVAAVAHAAARRFADDKRVLLEDRQVALQDPLPIFFEGKSRTDPLRVTHDAAIDDLFRNVRLLLTPTTPTRPCEHGGPGDGFHIHHTLPFNYSGHPAISIPAGFTSDGLPVGLQVVGRHYDEPLLLELAEQYESRHPWASVASSRSFDI